MVITIFTETVTAPQTYRLPRRAICKLYPSFTANVFIKATETHETNPENPMAQIELDFNGENSIKWAVIAWTHNSLMPVSKSENRKRLVHYTLFKAPSILINTSIRPSNLKYSPQAAKSPQL